MLRHLNTLIEHGNMVSQMHYRIKRSRSGLMPIRCVQISEKTQGPPWGKCKVGIPGWKTNGAQSTVTGFPVHYFGKLGQVSFH